MKLMGTLLNGAWLGIKTGFRLSLTYTVLFAAYQIIQVMLTPPDPNINAGMGAVLGVALAPYLILGGTVIGSMGMLLTGAIIGLILFCFKCSPLPQIAILVGGSFSLFIVALAHAFTWPSIIGIISLEIYFLLYGIPCIIYVIASSWIGQRLYKQYWATCSQDGLPL